MQDNIFTPALALSSAGKQGGQNMAVMTEEEAWALEEAVTKNPPKVSGDGTHGFFSRHKDVDGIFVDHVSATWLRVKSEATHKTPTEIISELVREKIAASL
jgi:hypothetical protein